MYSSSVGSLATVAAVTVAARDGEGLCVLRRRHMSILAGVVMGVHSRGRHHGVAGLMASIYAQREMDDS